MSAYGVTRPVKSAFKLEAMVPISSQTTTAFCYREIRLDKRLQQNVADSMDGSE